MERAVHGYEPLIDTFGLPDPKDEHVLAAAVVGGAGVIVTLNIMDYPRSALPPSVSVVTPADFAASTAEVDPSTSCYRGIWRAIEGWSSQGSGTPFTSSRSLGWDREGPLGNDGWHPYADTPELYALKEWSAQ